MANAFARTEVRWGTVLPTSGNVETATTTMTRPVYATNDPAILPGQSVIETAPLYSEKYQAAGHTKVGKRAPALSGLEFPWNAYSVPHILGSLFQSGADATGLKTFSSSQGGFGTINTGDTAKAPSATGADPVVLTVARSFEASGAEDHYLSGAVCSALKIAGDVGGIITASADFLGLGYSLAGTITAATANLSKLGLVYPLVDFDGATGGTLTLAGTAVTIRSFSINLANNARVASWNSRDPQCIVFGPKMAVTGELVLQADVEATGEGTVQSLLTALTTPTDKLLVIKNITTGSVDAAGEWSIEVNCRLTGDPEVTEGDSAYDVRVPFKGVYADASNHDIRVLVHDGTTGWGAVS
jgi:hypothetical protein